MLKKEKRPLFYNRPNAQGERWVENVSKGLRLAGFADELCRSINHTGWWTDEYGDNDTMRGVVYRLPHGWMVAGYADPCNDDCALLDFGTLFDNEHDAAGAADRIAEIHAERERDYQQAWQAGHLWAEKGEDIRNTRQEALGLLADIKAKRSALCDAPAIVATLRKRLDFLLSHIREIREDREGLERDYAHDKSGAFADGKLSA